MKKEGGAASREDLQALDHLVRAGRRGLRLYHVLQRLEGSTPGNPEAARRTHQRRLGQARTLPLFLLVAVLACGGSSPTAPVKPPVPFIITVFYESGVEPICYFYSGLEAPDGTLLLTTQPGRPATMNVTVPLGQTVTDTLWLSGTAPDTVVFVYNAYLGSITGSVWNSGNIVPLTGPFTGTFVC
jgi:hypothetical protein